MVLVIQFGQELIQRNQAIQLTEAAKAALASAQMALNLDDPEHGA
jgi:DNA-binding transcriptional LysR family regulator